MLSEYCIVTLDECKAYLAIAEGNTAHDTTLETWIDVVSRQFESEIDNKVAKQAVEETLDGDGTQVLKPTYYPIIGLVGDSEAERLANLQYRNEYDDAWADVTDDEDAIFFPSERPWEIRLVDEEYFPEGYQTVKVNYICGYDEIPGDIKKAVLEMLAQMWQESGKGQGRLGLSNVGLTTAGASINLSTRDVNKFWDQVVNRYRRIIP